MRTCLNTLIVLFISIIGLGACQSSKKAVTKLNYLQSITDSSKIYIPAAETRVERGDILDIRITSSDPKTDALFNAAGSDAEVSSTINAPVSKVVGYLVESDGTISLSRIGRITVAGKTKKEVVDIIAEKVEDYAKDIVVTVRFLNFKITVLGEVARQGTYSIPSERVTILEALGLAGDMTLYANRSNILVIRETDGNREFGRLNINEGNIFTSPFFHLKQNDVVYVEMTPRKVTSVDQTNTRNISLVLGALSTLGIILNVILR